jgi:MYXO-CTERM domain-containing protein
MLRVAIRWGQGWVLPAALVLVSCGKGPGLEDADVNQISARQVVVGPLVWQQTDLTLVPEDAPGRTYGSGVAMSGSTAVVGAYQDPEHGEESGSAYVFTRASGDFTQQSKLTAINAMPFDQFGAVAISGETLVVGARYDDSYGLGSGAAYAFERNGSNWTAQELPATGIGQADFFGWSVAVEGDTAIVGAVADDGSAVDTGSATVFVRSGSSWAEQQKLTANDGALDDYFGTRVALRGETALVGQANWRTGKGAAYVFVRSGTTWTQQASLTPASGQAIGAVALSGDLALVAGEEDELSQFVAVFTRSNGVWTEQQRLTPTFATLLFLELSGSSAFVGTASSLAPNAVHQMAMYERSGLSWAQTTLVPRVAGAKPSYGATISNDFALATTYLPNSQTGTIAVFHRGLADGDACEADDECASLHCNDNVCCNRECTGSCAACSVAAGADADGTCKVLIAGSLGEPACSPLTCTGTNVDCMECEQDTMCPSGSYCDASGNCRARKGSGESCDVSAGVDCRVATCGSCSSGFCVDGVCCDGPCDGSCEACLATLTGAADGACHSVPAGQDPDDECSAGQGSCRADGTCDGAGACRIFAASGTPCGETICAAGIVSGQLCDGVGSCRADEQTECAPYTCEGDACGTTCDADSDCASKARYCNAAHSCESRKPDGAECKQDEACASGFCVSGMCCNAACKAACETCSSPGSEGQCLPRADSECEPPTPPQGCVADADCPDGESCDSTSGLCRPVHDTIREASGCGCRVGVMSGSPGAHALMAAALALLLARRRRPRRGSAPVCLIKPRRPQF